MLRPSGDAFLDVLRSAEPAPDRAGKMRLYGFLVGSWTTDIVAHEENGTRHAYKGEIHAGWVLERRAPRGSPACSRNWP
jgi:hypothetical protein